MKKHILFLILVIVLLAATATILTLKMKEQKQSFDDASAIDTLVHLNADQFNEVAQTKPRWISDLDNSIHLEVSLNDQKQIEISFSNINKQTCKNLSSDPRLIVNGVALPANKDDTNFKTLYRQRLSICENEKTVITSNPKYDNLLRFN